MGSIEPLTRFSSVVKFQKMNSPDPTSTFITPYETYPPFGNPHCQTKDALVYRNKIREVTELGGPEWCLFYLENNGNIPDIKDQFNHLTNIWERDGFYVMNYFLFDESFASQQRLGLRHRSLVAIEGNSGRYLHNQVPSELGRDGALALSSYIKQSLAGREVRKVSERLGDGMQSWDIFKVKREFIERGSE